jgi:hypothetical protein
MPPLPPYVDNMTATIATLDGFLYVNGWRVSARDVDSSLGNGVFRAHTRYGDQIGRLVVVGNVIEDVDVNTSSRRRGAATAMLRLARFELGRVDHDWRNMTDVGSVWADAVG